MRIIAELGAGRKPQKGSFGAMPVGYCALRELMGSLVIDWVILEFVARMQRSGIRGIVPGFIAFHPGYAGLEFISPMHRHHAASQVEIFDVLQPGVFHHFL